ncbi:heterokaryon incompatibility protein-domain-containing protein [Xylariaceae sp. FL0016]|nr:heterokaryon incompatibility protein-domain-containing protein [Xylariaceae sp. FL0016]
MRLINTQTLEIWEFTVDVPPYAILSHTWGLDDDEVSFQEMSGSSLSSKTQSKPGYQKIMGFCAQARKFEFEYVWVDTCCIDKSSSAELSEAINSMFNWYKDAKVCYVFLSDVPCASSVLHEHESSPFIPKGRFGRSAWFTRGWTLQELIVPDHVEFYAADWTEIGTKYSLSEFLGLVTGISLDALEASEIELSDFSVAEKLSWAASRKTKRPEDCAYSLMGIFEVNMPLIYGEGDWAFYRLQEEIMKRTEDYTLFIWDLDPIVTSAPGQEPSIAVTSTTDVENDCKSSSIQAFRPPLPETPDAFAVPENAKLDYSEIERDAMIMQVHKEASCPPTITSRGLQLNLLMRKCSPKVYLAYMNCKVYGVNICALLYQEPYSAANTFTMVQSRRPYILLPRETLASFSFHTIYITGPPNEDEGWLKALARREASESLPLIVDATDLDYHCGWVLPADDKFQNGKLLHLTYDCSLMQTSKGIIRCLYDKTHPFIVVVSREFHSAICYCRIFLDGDSDSSGPIWPFYQCGSWLLLKPWELVHLPIYKDRDWRQHESFTVSAAIKVTARGRILFLSVSPNPGNAIAKGREATPDMPDVEAGSGGIL